MRARRAGNSSWRDMTGLILLVHKIAIGNRTEATSCTPEERARHGARRLEENVTVTNLSHSSYPRGLEAFSTRQQRRY